jgi:5-methyltetrahydrofolate--homocysteine methyltransferase
MNEDQLLLKLQECVSNFDVASAKNLAQAALEAGISTDKAINALAKGMETVGTKYENGEYFLSELIMAGETMREAMDILLSKAKAGPRSVRGSVVIGTVKGDVHSIGKDIVKAFLLSAGFDVHDLGVDVAAESFIECLNKTNANILAMSALLSTTMPYMATVVDELKKSGLRNKVKIIIGGAPLDDQYASEIGADAFGKDALAAVRICASWTGK